MVANGSQEGSKVQGCGNLILQAKELDGDQREDTSSNSTSQRSGHFFGASVTTCTATVTTTTTAITLLRLLLRHYVTRSTTIKILR